MIAWLCAVKHVRVVQKCVCIPRLSARCSAFASGDEMGRQTPVTTQPPQAATAQAAGLMAASCGVWLNGVLEGRSVRTLSSPLTIR